MRQIHHLVHAVLLVVARCVDVLNRGAEHHAAAVPSAAFAPTQHSLILEGVWKRSDGPLRNITQFWAKSPILGQNHQYWVILFLRSFAQERAQPNIGACVPSRCFRPVALLPPQHPVFGPAAREESCLSCLPHARRVNQAAAQFSLQRG